jgi:hypothetical protein
VTWHRCRRREWGPPPWSFAADAHDCIMVRIRTDLPNTSLWREDAPQWRAPLGSLPRHSTVVVRRRSFAETPSRCSASLRVLRRQSLPRRRPGALRNTSDAKRQSRQALLAFRRFGPLTPSARSGNLIAGDGMKNGLSRSEQRTGSRTQKQPLDRKSPIQVTLLMPGRSFW